MEILINPKYEYLKDFIYGIPSSFEHEGEEIYTGHNLIKIFSKDGLTINVKRYGIPHIINRVAYSFFRKPKGKRAYTYPDVLLSKGFETPEPIAYIEIRKFGFIKYSYFISLQSPYRYTFYQFGNMKIEECKEVITAFARYTARLHEAGILHRDYSPGNILFDEIDGEYHFSLVDINRMSFGEVSVETGCANFARLWGQPSFFELIAKEYAEARGADEIFCREKIFAYRKKFWTRFVKRHKVKYDLKL